MGFKLWPEAGSDFPYMDLPGVVRNYVRVDGPFNVDAWFAAFRKGRVFVSNGPFVTLKVDDHEMGDEFRVSRGSTVRVAADARLNPDFGPLDRLELVVSGDVVQTVAGGGDRIELKREVPIDRGVWIAVRAYGQGNDPRNLRVAHSAPIFVTVDNTGFVKTEALPELVARQRKLLAEMATSRVDPMGDLEPWETKELLIEQYRQTARRARVADRGSRSPLRRDAERESRPQAALAASVMIGFAAAALVMTRRRRG